MDYPFPRQPLTPQPSKSFTNFWHEGINHTKNSDTPFYLLSIPLLLFFLLPILAIFIKTPINSILVNLSERNAVKAISLSLFTSSITTLITVIFGTPVAYLLSQKRSRIFRVVDTLVDLPTVLPPAVAGVALLMAFGRKGIFASWLTAYGISIPFTTIAVIMAQTFIASPLFIKSATISFSGINNELKQAAALDGASRWQIFRYIVLPLSWMGMLSGCVMTWARALGEFGATIIFAGNFPGRTQTMPLAIYIGFEIELNVALTLSIILITISFLTLIIVKNVLHNKLQYC
jgi:molybdate transport system permease protein